MYDQLARRLIFCLEKLYMCSIWSNVGIRILDAAAIAHPP